MSTHIHEMHNDVSEVLFSEEQLKARVAELGAEIARDYADKDRVLLVSVLRGSYIFMADLSRAIDIPVEIDFMSVSSYGKGTKSSGQVEIKKDLSDSIEGVHVIVVEDILDSGNTLTCSMCWRPAIPPPSGCAPCWTSRSAASSPSTPTMSASPCPTPSSWATAWTTPKNTATCPISAF